MKVFRNFIVVNGQLRWLCSTAQKRFSTPKHLKERGNENIDLTESNLSDSVHVDIRPVETISKMEENDSLVETRVKSKMTTHRTMFSNLLKDSAPEDEEAVLEYYVRKARDNMETYDEAEYFDVVGSDRRLFFKMVDMWIQDAGEVKRGHREFIQVAMNNLNRFDVQYEPKAYLKILECYPKSEHTGLKRNSWFNAVWQDKILDHELAERLVSIMNKNKVIPTDEMYDVFTNLFGVYSRATAYLRNLLFWYPRLAAFSKFPITPQELEKLTQIGISVHAMRQVNPGIDVTYNYFKVDPSLLEDDDQIKQKQDCITSLQSDIQRKSLEMHDISQPVFVDGPHIVYFKNHRVQYYILRGDPVKKKSKKTEYRILTDKEWWMQFYGKDFVTSKSFAKSQQLYFEDSYLPVVKVDEESNDVHRKKNEIIQVSSDTKLVEGNIYAIAASNSQSIGMLRSWIKSLEPSNPSLSQITVVFNQNSSFLSAGYLEGPTTVDESGIE